MSEYQDAKKLAKALNKINATGLQVTAASILLAELGIERALVFVEEMAKLNALHAAKEADNGSS